VSIHRTQAYFYGFPRFARNDTELLTGCVPRIRSYAAIDAHASLRMTNDFIGNPPPDLRSYPSYGGELKNTLRVQGVFNFLYTIKVPFFHAFHTRLAFLHQIFLRALSDHEGQIYPLPCLQQLVRRVQLLDQPKNYAMLSM